MKKALIALGALALVGLVISPTAIAKPGGSGGPSPDPCYDIYSEHHVGPIVVYQYSSCSYDVGYDEDWQPSDELP